MSRFIVGLTGGIGSGKTAVSDRFAALGIAVVDADVASRVIVEPGRPALAAIAEHYGAHLLHADGTLDRGALRAIVFGNADERRWLEQLTHPLIAVYLREELAKADSIYAMLVSPLLFETSQSTLCDRVLVVDVPRNVQLERTMQRDDVPRAQVEAIIAAQIDRDSRLDKADDVIVNDRDLGHLDACVAQLHERYLTLAAASGADRNDRSSS